MEAITREEIICEQEKHQKLAGVEKDDQGIHKKGKPVWIPNDAASLKLCITIEVHCEDHGHQAYDALLDMISQSCWWSHVKEDVR